MAPSDSDSSSAGRRPRLPLVLRGALVAVLAVASLVYLVGVVWARREEIAQVLDFDTRTLVLLLVLSLASHLQRTLELEYIFRRLGAKGTFVDGFLLTGASLLLNYLPLSAGSVARAVVLRRRHGLSYFAYVSALTYAAIINIGVAAGCGLIASLWLLWQVGAAAPFSLLCGVIAGGSVLAALAPAAWAPKGDLLPARVARQLVERVASIRAGGVGIVVLAGTSSLKLALNTSRLWICFHALQIDLAPQTAVLLGAVAVMATIVNLVPNNLGIREVLLGVVTQVLGGSAVLGVVAASMERAVMLIYTVVVGLVGIHYLRRRRRQGEDGPRLLNCRSNPPDRRSGQPFPGAAGQAMAQRGEMSDQQDAGERSFVDTTPYDKHFEYRKDFMDIAPRFFLRTNLMLGLLGEQRGTVLDVGCGDGFFLRRLARRGFRGVGIDVSTAGIERAKHVLAEYPQCEVHCAPIQEFGPDAGYSLVTCGETLEHIEDDVEFLRQINRLMKPRGGLVLTVPIDMTLWTQHDVEAGHFRRYSKQDLFEKLERTGFTVEEYLVWGFPLVRLSHLQIRRAQTKRMAGGSGGTKKRDLLMMLKPLLRVAKHVVRLDNLFNFTERGVGIVLRATKTREASQ